MSNVKNAVIRVLVGIVVLVTFSACETTKQGKIMSAEDVREQPQVSSDVDVSAGRSDEKVIGAEEFGSSDFIPESLPGPTPEGESDVVAVEGISPTQSLPAEPLEFPEGNRGPASDSGPESLPQPVDTPEVASPVEPTDAVEALTTKDIEPEELTSEPEVPDEGKKDSQLEHVFFGFDQYSIRDDAVSVLERNAEMLNGRYKDSDVLIEGHCDERGTTDYNVELGKRRAQAVKDYLIDLGVEASRIKIVSYGKEKPFCHESEPACWQQNRRGHFVLQ